MTGAAQQATDHQVVPHVTTRARLAWIVTITTTSALLIRGMSRGRIVDTGMWPGLWRRLWSILMMIRWNTLCMHDLSRSWLLRYVLDLVKRWMVIKSVAMWTGSGMRFNYSHYFYHLIILFISPGKLPVWRWAWGSVVTRRRWAGQLLASSLGALWGLSWSLGW